MKKIIFLVSSFLFLTTSVMAQEYQSPRTLALGGAGRGAPLLNDSIYLNPSYASFTPIYSMSGGWTWFNNDSGKGRNYNLSVEDSRTELFQAGVGFTRREQNAALNFGASKQVIQRLGVGIGSKTIIDDTTNHKMTTDFMFATSFIATQWLYASLIVDNLLESDSAKQRNLYRSFFIGTKFIVVPEIQFYLDPHYAPNYAKGKKAGFSLGAEFAMLADFYLRGGRFQNTSVAYLNTYGSGFGLGLGWLGPKLNLEYAMNRVTSADNFASITTAQSLQLTIFL